MSLLRAATAMSRYYGYRVRNANTCRLGMRRLEADDAGHLARTKRRAWTD